MAIASLVTTAYSAYAQNQAQQDQKSAQKKSEKDIALQREKERIEMNKQNQKAPDFASILKQKRAAASGMAGATAPQTSALGGTPSTLGI